MKILVADKIADSGIAMLREQGFEVVEAYGSSPEKVIALSSDVDAIIVRSATKITREVFAAAKNLKAVGRAGVGVDNIDVDAATERGVIVMNTPGGNTIAACELAFTHLLCTARPIVQADASMKSGKWDKKSFEGIELNAKVLGVIGLGRIGGNLAKRALAFNMRVLAYDPYLTEEKAHQMGVEKVELDALLAQADYISIHMPKTAETNHMINADAIAKLKQGVRIVNCARGGLIDEAALVDALKSGKIAAAGLDVFDTEPLAADSPLRTLKNVVLTPHLGASTVEAQEGVGIEVAEAIGSVLKGGMIKNAVNAPSVDPATLKVLAPYLKLGELLGNVLQQISDRDVTKITIKGWGKMTSYDNLPVVRAIQRGYLHKIAQDINDVNAPRAMKRLGIEIQAIHSNTDVDYTDLLSVESECASGAKFCVAGTIYGKSQKPRLVHMNGRDVEALLSGYLLVTENNDVPGIVGHIGTILANNKLNIANMSLSRNSVGGVALNISTLDSKPSDEAKAELLANKDIKSVHLVDLVK
jgi:D-3-phosphoglycerate dehydrogenase / 2-oxoglutarate reductase